MWQYIIIETVFGTEYKIAMESHRFIGPRMYMLLADTFSTSTGPDDIGERYNNKFKTYEEAVKIIEILKLL